MKVSSPYFENMILNVFFFLNFKVCMLQFKIWICVKACSFEIIIADCCCLGRRILGATKLKWGMKCCYFMNMYMQNKLMK